MNKQAKIHLLIRIALDAIGVPWNGGAYDADNSLFIVHTASPVPADVVDKLRELARVLMNDSTVDISIVTS